MLTPEQSLAKAVHTVTDMLTKKKDIWTANEGVFKNFEIHQELGICPLQFGLAMANLKMQRAKTRFNAAMYSSERKIHDDTDIEDSLIDLASYALLSLGILYADREETLAIDHSHTKEFVEMVKENDATFNTTVVGPAWAKWLNTPEGIEYLKTQVLNKQQP